MKKDLKAFIIIVLMLLIAIGTGVVIGSLIARVGQLGYQAEYSDLDAVVQSNELMLRERPHKNGKVIEELYKGQKLFLTGYTSVNNDKKSPMCWVEVILADTETRGWVYIDGLDLKPKKAS